MGSFVGTESDGRLFSEGNELKLMLCTETGFLGEKDEETWGTGTQPLRESNPEPFPLKSRTHGDRSTSGLKAISLVSPNHFNHIDQFNHFNHFDHLLIISITFQPF
jgi:hypothetical protein